MKRTLLTVISVIATLFAVSTEAIANSEYKYYDVKQSRTENISVSDTLGTITDNIDQDTIMQLYAVDEFPRFEQCKDVSIEESQQCFKQHLYLFIVRNFSYPEAAMDKGLQGIVNVVFKINTNGIVEILEAKGEHPILNNHARTIIERLPRFIPAKYKGVPVAILCIQPIRFTLNDTLND